MFWGTGNLGRPNDYALFVDQGPLAKLSLVMLTVAVGPFLEEIVFRGYFFRIVRTQYGPWLAALLVNLLFMATHIGSPRALAIIFAKGLLFTYVYQKSQSIWGSTIAHSMNNLSARVFSYLL
jgi:membrane protease YdiL (CAAX protease family)